MVRIKICGITEVEDARMCVDAGADALGLNFYRQSPRWCSLERAAEIVRAVGNRTLCVGVFVNATAEEILETQERTGIGCGQLHGDEPPELLARFLPHAYKALSVRDASSAAEVARYGGEYILLDAYVKGQRGGTGTTFDWTLARDVAAGRKLTLAGGLTPANVALAVRQARPFCVDVASGVESKPGRKDPQLVRAFVEAARG